MRRAWSWRSARLVAALAGIGTLGCGSSGAGGGNAAVSSDGGGAVSSDAGRASEGGVGVDGGSTQDASASAESGSAESDGSSPGDGSTVHDGGGVADGAPIDAGGARQDAGTDAGAGADAGCSGSYDAIVLCDHPVAYWALDMAPATEPDLTGNGNPGTYMGGTPAPATLPNGDGAATFNGSSEYLTIAQPSNASLSIPTTGNLTWEGWIMPAVLQFPHDDGQSGYVDWMGKCDEYSPTCEWEARMYDTTTKESPNRPNRLSAYVFNATAGLGSAADWQPAAGLIEAGSWYHVVGEYTTLSQPPDCPSVPASPGSIAIWVNGVPWSQTSHSPTGCMSQYNVVPTANSSAVNIGTMAMDSWFDGAIGKVAIYGTLLSQARIAAHYEAMTGKAPSGTCGDTCSF